jgi:hypothetical protein
LKEKKHFYWQGIKVAKDIKNFKILKIIPGDVAKEKAEAEREAAAKRPQAADTLNVNDEGTRRASMDIGLSAFDMAELATRFVGAMAANGSTAATAANATDTVAVNIEPPPSIMSPSLQN